MTTEYEQHMLALAIRLQRANARKAEAEAEMAAVSLKNQRLLLCSMVVEQEAKTEKAKLEADNARMISEHTRTAIANDRNPLGKLS